MLNDLLEKTQLSRDACARIVGVSTRILDEWIAGQRRIPTGYARSLSELFGVPHTVFQQHDGAAAEQMAGVWFRMREDRVAKRVSSRDRTYVGVLRRLANHYDQFERATTGSSPSMMWHSVFADAKRNALSESSSPAEQGRVAARSIRTERGLSQGAVGIGSVFRQNLRKLGIVIVETPVAESKIEGCSFYVQSDKAIRRPCVFANSFRSTWFHRNFVLCHEIAHLIFDAESEGASIDFKVDEDPDSVTEQRADAFAQEMLVPASVLRHTAQAAGIQWTSLKPEDLATLVAKIEVEARVILKAAVDSKLIDSEVAAAAQGYEIQTLLEQKTERALPATKYFHRFPEKRADQLEKRIATAAGVKLYLPSAYVQSVVEAMERGTISWAKAAELLIIDRDTFMERFGDRVPVVE
jgi:Zn-dependent peptidase ImmA (M78 family)